MPTAYAGPAKPDPADLPLHIHGGAWPTSHVQGVAIDAERGYMYWSFTQMLVKTDLDGNVVGTVTGLTGHLGDLDVNPKDGRVYGSLEYKAEEAFYIAIFDVDAIDRVGMDAEGDGVMTAVHLDEVVADFTADMDGNGVFDGDTANTPDHRYGSSGIDGVAFGPAFGKTGGKNRLVVAYGIYTNTSRTDNDHQVLLSYDVTRWRKYEQPLDQDAPHRSGPAAHDGKYFVFTGNTHFGVQNLEYDPYTRDWLMAVYDGRKPAYPNYSFFRLDGETAPRTGLIRGQATPETGQLLELEQGGLHHPASGTFGYEFHGNYGIVALGDGYYYVAEGKRVERDGAVLQDGDVYLYRWTGETPAPFERVTRR
ncbi:hypothetical protein [Nocardioides xinjiangensis]|uniref:hypothetical protein n=1 Tax=Nocardioides xinjiangensis TaxID=2817376 RepID=UPI001B30A7DA|nr:hypothetical protein [Nocardioides sp. SYSU D00514]